MNNFRTIPISSILINREERQRRELADIPDLADSLSRIGLINAIVITRENVLVAGERRLTAAKSLGWDSITAQYVDDLDPLSLQVLEFEENVRRLDLSWQDRCTTVEKYHSLRLQQEEGWTARDTARALGLTDSEVKELRDVAKEIERGNTRVIDADKFSTARNVTRRGNERARTSSLASISFVDGGDNAGVDVGESAEPIHGAPFLNTDFSLWAPTYAGPPFNFIHCDFPYGVSMHKTAQGSAAQVFGTYHDHEDVYWDLLRTLDGAMANVVAESAHLMFWFSMDFYADTRELLTLMGWRVNPFPLIWTKSDNTGVLPDPNRGPRRTYETAFFASRGDRLIATPVSNTFAHPGREKTIHMNEKPIPMLQHFMRMFVDEHSRVLDPTMGSGNALHAARNLGADAVFGLEKDEGFFTLAREAWISGQD